MTIPTPHINDLIHQTAASVEAAIPIAERDLRRPVFHFRPPAQWMNDPNGTIYHNGYYHLFYQFNPYHDTWATMHWGHARSRDLVSWEHLPIALYPAQELGEEHCFSGCAYVDAQLGPMLFYTSMGRELPEQWVAVGDAEWLTWSRPAANPVLNMAAHQGIEVNEWRDPFIFHAAGRTLMVLGGKIGAEPVTLIYEKGADALTWTYQGVLFRHPRTNFTSLECPNFFKLRDTWVLLDSPFGPVEYFMGAFDPATLTFAPTSQGLVDHSSHFYATNLFCEDHGRTILVGWIRGFASGNGWNGCLSLPRMLSLDDDGALRQHPLPALQQLRGAPLTCTPILLQNANQRVKSDNGQQLEILAQFERGDAQQFGLKVRSSQDGNRAVTISYDGRELDVAGIKFPVALTPQDATLTLHIFLDRAVLEVFVNDGRACATAVLDAPIEDQGVEVFAQGGHVTMTQLTIWEMQSIW